MHGGVDAEDLGGYDDVLREVLGDATADHEEAGARVFDFELGDLVEVLGGVDGDGGLALAGVLVGDEAEACGAVGEGGAEDGDVLLVGGEDDGVVVAVGGGAVVGDEVGAHFADELARGVGAVLEGVGDLAGDVVADAELFLVDEGVVDAVDHELAEDAVFVAVFVLVGGDVVAVAEGLEEVLVDDVGSGGDDGVDHVVAEEVDEELLEASGDEGAGEAEDDAAVGVAEHHVVDRWRRGRCRGRCRPWRPWRRRGGRRCAA